MLKTRIPTDRAPTHPGVILLKEFLEPLGLSQKKLAHLINVHYPRVNEIVNGKRGVSPDTALRLSKLFGTTPEFWLNGQMECDLYEALQSAKDSKSLEAIEPLEVASAA